ncbi:hypothetical protein JCM6882_008923 [Rhodosporidiobolus microsporus]
MPSSTLSLFSALLAFSSSFLLVAAAPNPAWYLAPTVTSSSVAPAKTTTSSLVWYKADPTTTSKPSPSPSAFSTVWYRAPASSAAPLPSPSPSYYSGNLSTIGTPSCTMNCFFGVWTVFPDAPSCPDSSLPDVVKKGFGSQYFGLSLSPDFYNKHGGLDKFCGKGVQLIDPNNPHAVSDTYYIARSCTDTDCPGDSLGGGHIATLSVRQNWTASAVAAGDEDYHPSGRIRPSYAVQWRFV